MERWSERVRGTERGERGRRRKGWQFGAINATVIIIAKASVYQRNARNISKHWLSDVRRHRRNLINRRAFIPLLLSLSLFLFFFLSCSVQNFNHTRIIKIRFTARTCRHTHTHTHTSPLYSASFASVALTTNEAKQLLPREDFYRTTWEKAMNTKRCWFGWISREEGKERYLHGADVQGVPLTVQVQRPVIQHPAAEFPHVFCKQK